MLLQRDISLYILTWYYSYKQLRCHYSSSQVSVYIYRSIVLQYQPSHIHVPISNHCQVPGQKPCIHSDRVKIISAIQSCSVSGLQLAYSPALLVSLDIKSGHMADFVFCSNGGSRLVSTTVHDSIQSLRAAARHDETLECTRVNCNGKRDSLQFTWRTIKRSTGDTCV